MLIITRRVIAVLAMCVLIVVIYGCKKDETSAKEGTPVKKVVAEKKAAITGKDLPEFTLKDPRGKAFSRKDILNNGVVFVVTAPTLSNKNVQTGWANYLKSTKHDSKARLIFLQDMSASSFPGMALSEMKKQDDPNNDPLLLIDQEGVLRSKLGVEKEHTAVFVYNSEGKRVHEERGGPSEKSASLIWKSLE